MMTQATCEGCGEDIDDVIVESFELTGKLLCESCATEAFEAAGDGPERSCAACRFRAEKLNAEYTRCGWLTDTQDEAGDRMPRWAHAAALREGKPFGLNTRADDCPAFEVAS